ncbi:hypothetical protein K474DRAFT_1658722 [Panus rudis PR-1116 ss-1]|nr:hypothetical protein K474DRAFT_1658722 [Panus rudis PR-1116 ss-1]
MAAGKLFNLIALTALALFATSFAPTPVNALASPALHARHHAIQESFNRKKRDSVASRANTKRCRPRPTSSVASASPTTAPAASQAPTSAPSPTKASETSSPASQPTHSSGGNSGNGSGGNLFSGGKVGLAWPNAGDPSLKNFITGNVGGLYTWSPFCPDNSPVPCYRMLWGDNQVQQFEQQVKGPATENDNVILGFNEPNEPGQSNMSPQHACELWHQHIQPKKQLGYTLVAPATSSNPNGLTWVQDFMKCCSDCTVIKPVFLRSFPLELNSFDQD